LTLDRRNLGGAFDLDASRALLLDPAEPALDEVGLFHLYNRLREEGGSMLLVSSRPAGRWGVGLKDLASRLAAAPSVAIGAPDDQLLAALFLKLFDDRQLKAPESVIRYLVTHMERSFAAARRLVEDLDRLSLARQRPITISLARLALEGPEAG
jgi:chromosomal replication initiation ATPase DnaA